MKLPISKRLLACAAFVEPGQRVADVGTDHGYLAIYLLQSRRASRVLAADVAEQPLARARENARRFGVREGLSFPLCDGVRGLPRDFGGGNHGWHSPERPLASGGKVPSGAPVSVLPK